MEETIKLSEAQFNKLPKWAQHELKRLCSNVNYYQKKNIEMLGLYQDSNTKVKHFNNQTANLPNNSTILFNPNGNEGEDISVSCSSDGVSVMAEGMFGHDMVVSPQSNNHVKIKFLKRG